MPNNSFEEQLKKHLSKFNTYPYLFIGSGLSIRYFNLDSWINLLKNICTELSLNDYSYYASSSNQDFTKIAEMMAKDFKEKWWKENIFSESRTIFKDKTINDESPLKYEICKYIENKAIVTNATNYLEEIELLKKSNIDGIITTNWDNFIEEQLFKDFNCFLGQEELIFSDSFDIGITYKIHGGIKDPNSLILTKQDYDNFESRYPYLAAKLLTVFVEHPVIFLGYSIQDKNIQSILKSIIACLSTENISKLKDRLIFCEWKSGELPSLQDHTMSIDGTILPMKLIKTDSFKPIFSVLSDLKRKIPIKILKNMKNMVYEFVKSSEPKSKVYVTDDLVRIEDQNNAEFVYGIGIMDKLAKVGIKGLKIDNLIRDVVFDDGKWDSKDICNELLIPFKSGKQNVPYFKYLKTANLLDKNNKLNSLENVDFTKKIDKIIKSSIKYFEPTSQILKKKNDVIKNYDSFSIIFNDTNLNNVYKYTYPMLINPKETDLQSLEAFLKSNYEKEMNSNPISGNISHYRKLVCYYDYLKYIYFDNNN